MSTSPLPEPPPAVEDLHQVLDDPNVPRYLERRLQSLEREPDGFRPGLFRPPADVEDPIAGDAGILYPPVLADYIEEWIPIADASETFCWAELDRQRSGWAAVTEAATEQRDRAIEVANERLSSIGLAELAVAVGVALLAGVAAGIALAESIGSDPAVVVTGAP